MKNNDFEKAVKIIKKGGIVICPTDTVYGLIADATNKKAVEKIFKIKKRPKSKPLAVFVSSIEQAKELAYIDEPAFAPSSRDHSEAKQEKILKKYWPGKYTFILKSKIPSTKSQINSKFKSNPSGSPSLRSVQQNSKFKLSKLMIGKGNTIGIRIPNYKFLLDLLKKINKPLAQTSANISGKPASTKIKEVLKQFYSPIYLSTPHTSDRLCVESENFISLIVDAGNLPKSKPSKVIDLTGKIPKTIRH